jgi:hypothetical protein
VLFANEKNVGGAWKKKNSMGWESQGSFICKKRAKMAASIYLCRDSIIATVIITEIKY